MHGIDERSYLWFCFINFDLVFLFLKELSIMITTVLQERYATVEYLKPLKFYQPIPWI